MMNRIGNEIVLDRDGTRRGEDLPWIPSPKFEGVAMRNLLEGTRTRGRMSAHLVRIEPGKAIGEHVHEGSFEIHEILEGSGVAAMPGELREYRPGVVSLIPQGSPHEVRAGKDGLVLLAKFAPALG
ncbi:MAG TPA: cupin domain-containing protein [Fibrobacteria bacterium]|nr:cupin domain-containing protein [Fibrobacteria bacterium]